MNWYFKATSRETAYLSALTVYIFSQVLSFSRYVDLLSGAFFLSLKLVILGLLLVSAALQKRLSLREAAADFLLFGIGLFAASNSEKGYALAVILLFIAAGAGLSFRRLLRLTMSMLAAGWLFVTFSCLAGLIENRTYSRPALDLTAQTYGFNYYAYPTMIFFTCSIIYLVLRERKTTWLQLGLVLLANYAAAQVYTTRIYLWAILAFELYFILAYKLKLITLKSRIFGYISRWGYLLSFLAAFFVYQFYQPSKTIWSALNAFLSGRLELGRRALDVYPLTLFGTEVTMSGNAERVYGNVSGESDYIDSGYLYTLLAYGILFTLLIILCYTVTFQYLCRRKEVLLYGWMGLFMFLNIFNNYVLSIEINPLLLLTLTAIRERPAAKRRLIRFRSHT